jgi:hypothetical protein
VLIERRSFRQCEREELGGLALAASGDHDELATVV